MWEICRETFVTADGAHRYCFSLMGSNVWHIARCLIMCSSCVKLVAYAVVLQPAVLAKRESNEVRIQTDRQTDGRTDRRHVKSLQCDVWILSVEMLRDYREIMLFDISSSNWEFWSKRKPVFLWDQSRTCGVARTVKCRRLRWAGYVAGV